MNARAAVSVITLLMASVSGWTQTSFDSRNNTSSITVTVRSANNASVGDARVEARDTSTGRLMGTGYTNASGTLELPNLPVGPYEVVATSGLNEVHDRADTRMGDAFLTMRLPVEASSAAGNSTTVSVAQFKVPGKARDEFKKADEALSKRKLDDCKKHLAKALEIYPNFAEALTLRGVIAMDDKNTDSAMSDFDAAIKADGSYPLAYFAMGATYNTMAKYDDAIRVIERGVTLAPNSWQGYFELGKAEIGKATYEAAIHSLDKAQSLAPQGYALIHLVKAHALLAMKDYTNAMGELQAFLEKGPKDGVQTQSARDLLGKVQAFTASAQAH